LVPWKRSTSCASTSSVTFVVIDASAGVEIVADTRRGRALARLVPAGSEGWVPEHFYAEVLAVLRRRFLIERRITEMQASAAVARLTRGIFAARRSRRSSPPPGSTPQHDRGRRLVRRVGEALAPIS